MAIGRGTYVGPYQITALIGEGGAGQVWRAHHATLDRDDALRVLPEVLAADSEHHARFEHETRVLASLNHPNIARVYGVENAAGARALVMELVEGPSLADRLVRGPVPLDEALPIARQIAAAIEAAHECGIVHGHLNPAKVKLAPDGTVKVLGFGHGRSGVEDAGASTTSPTVTAITVDAAGATLDAAAYVSPEQAVGKPVDKRSDLWAFGVVVLEMLTGHRVFSGDTVSDVLAAVLNDEPDWTALPAETPAPIRRLLRRCLEKDRRQRLADVANARLEIDDALKASGVTEAAEVAHGVGALPVGLALLATLLVTALATWWMMRPPPPAPAPVTRFTITPPPGLPLTSLSLYRDVALAPDGSFLVYAAGNQGLLVIRRFDQLQATPLTGVRGASAPFVSPDGRWIGYFEDYTTLKKVALVGGSPITLARVPGTPRGAAWVDDATIIVATGSPTTGLLRVPAGGGDRESTVLTTPDAARGELGHWHPSALPGGRAVLFTIAAAEPANARIAVLDLETGQYTTLIQGGRDAQYVSSGHLLHARTGGTLFATRFDLAQMLTVGDPVAVLEGVSVAGTGSANAAVSQTGTLVYLPSGAGGVPPRSLAWVDRQGRETPIPAPSRAYVSPRLSPDGRRVALEVRDQDQDIWIWNFAEQTMVRLTSDPAGEAAPVWTPDGRRVVFASTRMGTLNLYVRAADASGEDVHLVPSTNAQAPTSITPDGTWVIAHEIRAKTARDLVRVALPREAGDDGTRAVEGVLETPQDELNGALSPDGRFIAYQSNESGRSEIYVRPYPQVTSGRWLVSANGGTKPTWTRGGKEVIFLDGANLLTAVPVDASESGFRAGTATTLLQTAYAGPAAYRTYDVTADGERFLVIKDEAGTAGAAPPRDIIVVENWMQELARLVPAR